MFLIVNISFPSILFFTYCDLMPINCYSSILKTLHGKGSKWERYIFFVGDDKRSKGVRRYIFLARRERCGIGFTKRSLFHPLRSSTLAPGPRNRATLWGPFQAGYKSSSLSDNITRWVSKCSISVQRIYCRYKTDEQCNLNLLWLFRTPNDW